MRLFVGIPFWIAIPLWLLFIGFMLLLSFAGLLVAAAGGVIYLTGAGLDAASPGRGTSCKELGSGIYHGMIQAVDRMNGHGKPRA